MRIKIAGSEVEITGPTCAPWDSVPRRPGACPYCLDLRCRNGWCAEFGSPLLATLGSSTPQRADRTERFDRCGPCLMEDASGEEPGEKGKAT